MNLAQLEADADWVARRARNKDADGAFERVAQRMCDAAAEIRDLRAKLDAQAQEIARLEQTIEDFNRTDHDHEGAAIVYHDMYREQLARAERAEAAMEALEGGYVTSTCKMCGRDWPHPGVLSSFPICFGCASEAFAKLEVRDRALDAVRISCSVSAQEQAAAIIEQERGMFLPIGSTESLEHAIAAAIEAARTEPK
jgi:hypothetical protein